MSGSDREMQTDLFASLKGHRDGITYDPVRDCGRLNSQCQDVFDVVKNGKWYTLAALSELTGHPEASISARLRDLRKPRFGGYRIERKYLADGLFCYRMNEDSE